jgi:hypothetical protein
MGTLSSVHDLGLLGEPLERRLCKSPAHGSDDNGHAQWGSWTIDRIFAESHDSSGWSLAPL